MVGLETTVDYEVVANVHKICENAELSFPTWTTNQVTSLVPSLHTSPSKKWSGEQSWISWVYHPKAVRLRDQLL